MTQLLLFPECPPVGPGPRLLTGDEQGDVIDLLLRGGSPQAVCQRLDLDLHDYCRTVDEDPAFRRQLQTIREVMTQNVIAVVYAGAMKGTPAAQSLWLRLFFAPSVADADESMPPTETPDVYADHTLDSLRRTLEAYDEARRGT